MKNIHILPTDKPSRLHTYKGVLNLAAGEFVAPTIVKNDLINQNIYITSDEEIKEGDKILSPTNEIQTCISLEKGIGTDNICWIRVKETTTLQQILNSDKIILTTDTDLIKDGVQPIDDDFLEWFVKNPSCEEVKWNAYPISPNGNIVATNRPYPFEGLISNFKIDYKIIIPKEEYKQETHICKYCKAETTQSDDQCYAKPKQETLEEVAERFWRNDETMSDYVQQAYITGFIAGSKWMQERMYSEDDMKECWNASYVDAMSFDEITYKPLFFEDFMEQLKKK